MYRIRARSLLIFLVVSFFAGLEAQEVQSTVADLALPGNWQAAKQFASAQFGSDIFYDSGTGALIQISEQAGMRKAGDIAKFFGGVHGPSREAAADMSAAEFPLPLAYTERASRELGKGNKPPKMWDLKEGEGNPVWFYASQLFDDYRMRDAGGSSEVTEEYLSVRVNQAEQRPVAGGDVLLFEVETEKPAGEPAYKRFRMPAGLKDQRIRYGWVQFAPGGIASGQGVLSVAYAVAANSGLTIDEVAKQVSGAKIKPQ